MPSELLLVGASGAAGRGGPALPAPLPLELDENREAEADAAAPEGRGDTCRLPPADRAQRTADFRALFDGTFVDRARLPTGVCWTLRPSETTEAESRRLAALEARCCDGVRFEVSREAERIVTACQLASAAGPARSSAPGGGLGRAPLRHLDRQRV